MVVPIYVKSIYSTGQTSRFEFVRENTRQSNFTTRYDQYCMASKDKKFFDHSYEYEVCMKFFILLTCFILFYNTNNREDFP